MENINKPQDYSQKTTIKKNPLWCLQYFQLKRCAKTQTGKHQLSRIYYNRIQGALLAGAVVYADCTSA